MFKRTPGIREVEIGEDRCFHQGNRVAITVSGEEDGEPYNVTIAEFWPVHTARAHDDLVAALTWLLDDLTDAGEDHNPETGTIYDSVANARTALAKAKE